MKTAGILLADQTVPHVAAMLSAWSLQIMKALLFLGNRI